MLEGAFTILAALAGEQDGLGLSQLSRKAGLPKATTHRLVEQLVGLGAVECHERCYRVGRTVARLGRAWQPDPWLRRAAVQPARTLAALSHVAVAVTVLDGDRLRLVTGTRGILGELPGVQAGSDVAGRTAAGQVLLAVQQGAPVPEGYSAAEWRRVRSTVRDRFLLQIEHQEPAISVCCVAAVIPLPNAGTASISAVAFRRNVPSGLSDLVSKAAAEVSRNIAVR